MTHDHMYALLLFAFFAVTVTTTQFGPQFLELLLKLTRPGATIVLLGLLAYVFGKGYRATFIVLLVVVVYLLRDIWTVWLYSDARRLYIDRSTDESRFDPASSIDIQMANKTVTHASPSLYFQPAVPTGLLVFPPSAATLEQLNG